LSAVWHHANPVAISLFGAHGDVPAEACHADDRGHEIEDMLHVLYRYYLTKVDLLHIVRDAPCHHAPDETWCFVELFESLEVSADGFGMSEEICDKLSPPQVAY
jgi:hypothetical protein